MKHVSLSLVPFCICLLSAGCQRPEEYKFSGVEGPNTSSVLPKFTETSFERYGKGGLSRLAILINDEPINWLSLAHGLKTIGVPFIVTQDPDVAIRHTVVFVYPEMTKRNWSPKILKKLKQFVYDGGTLVASPVIDALEDVFGIQRSHLNFNHTLMFLNENVGINHIFKEPEERLLRLKPPSFAVSMHALKMRSYTLTSAESLAYYGNNTPAIIQNRWGKGTAFAFGFDLGGLITKNYAYGASAWGSRVANQFIPTLDVFLRMIRELYLEKEPNGIVIGTVPHNKLLTVLVAHDVVDQIALKYIPDYVSYESNAHLPSTYFVATKYLSDYEAPYFFNNDEVSLLKKVASLDMEIGSNTVSYSTQFYKMPVGSGSVKYPNYKPLVMNRRVTLNGTVMGELRVSKFLLEKLVGVHVNSFSARYLMPPRTLPQVLEATDYLYSSSCSANVTWSHLPFQLNYCYGNAMEVNIFEFPVTLENIALPDRPDQLEEGIAVAKKIAGYGGMCMLLLAPTEAGHKLECEKKFVDSIRDIAWFGTLKEYGDWWAARNEIQVDVLSSGDKKIVSLVIPKAIKGLSLLLPQNWKFESALPENQTIAQEGRKLSIGMSSSKMRLVFDTKDKK